MILKPFKSLLANISNNCTQHRQNTEISKKTKVVFRVLCTPQVRKGVVKLSFANKHFYNIACGCGNFVKHKVKKQKQQS